MNQFFMSGGQSIRASASVLPINQFSSVAQSCPTLSNEYSGVISFRIDWLDLLAVHGTLKGLLQHCRSKASILLRSTFFMVQLSHPYMTTGKTIALTRWTSVGKVMCRIRPLLSPSSLAVTFLLVFLVLYPLQSVLSPVQR